MSPIHRKTQLLVLTMLGSLLTGCDSDRVAEMATKAADRQAEQTLLMGELNREVASGSRALVAADAEARQDIVAVHRDLQGERGRLDNQWTALEQERQQIARERRTESLLLPAMQVVGGILLVVTLLGFCSRALDRSLCDSGVAGNLNELLIQELLADPMPLPADSVVHAVDGFPSAPRLARDESLPSLAEP